MTGKGDQLREPRRQVSPPGKSEFKWAPGGGGESPEKEKESCGSVHQKLISCISSPGLSFRLLPLPTARQSVWGMSVSQERPSA